MKDRSLFVIVTGLLLLNIFDGSFNNPGILDWIKMPLFVLCYILLLRGDKKDES